MSHEIGIWLDHKKAVIVSATAGQVAVVKTVAADVDPHPHFAGSHEGGGEKKYEERHSQALDRYYDDVIILQRSCFWVGNNSRKPCIDSPRN